LQRVKPKLKKRRTYSEYKQSIQNSIRVGWFWLCELILNCP